MDSFFSIWFRYRHHQLEHHQHSYTPLPTFHIKRKNTSVLHLLSAFRFRTPSKAAFRNVPPKHLCNFPLLLVVVLSRDCSCALHSLSLANRIPQFPIQHQYAIKALPSFAFIRLHSICNQVPPFFRFEHFNVPAPRLFRRFF